MNVLIYEHETSYDGQYRRVEIYETDDDKNFIVIKDGHNPFDGSYRTEEFYTDEEVVVLIDDLES